MKNKRTIAVALCIGLVTSSFSGFFISEAQNNIMDIEIVDNTIIDNNLEASITDGIKIESEYNIDETAKSLISTVNSSGEGEVIYQSTERIENTNNPDTGDIFNIGEKEVQELLYEGYSIQDILKADEIGNEIIEDPIKILDIASSSGKSLDDVKEDLKKEKKEKYINEYKFKYKNDYKKLEDHKFTEDEIISLLTYKEANNLQLTDELVNDYKKNGDKAFKNIKEVKEKKLTKETQKKYQLTEQDANKLTDEKIKLLEEIAQKINKPIDEVIETYIKCN